MENGILSDTGLVFVYGGMLTLGLALIAGAIISLLRSFTPGSQNRPQNSSHPLFNRATTYSFGLGAAVFGAAGLLAVILFRLDPVVGILISLGLGLLAGLIALGILVYLPSIGRAEEKLIDYDVAGRRAKVIITIPGNGLGEVVFLDGKKQINLGARSTTGLPIEKGATVVIERVTKRVAVVTPLTEGSNVVTVHHT